ncbi:MAG: MFS transporter [Thermoleophilia bacterium]
MGTEPTERAVAHSGRRTNLALAAVSAGVFLTALDQTMVVTIIPSILRDLRIPITRLDDAAWIVTGYLLGYTVAMPLFGRVADVRGRRLFYLVALVVFMAGSVLCVLAPDLTTLVAARVIQAAGGGAVVPIAMAVAAYLFPPRRLAFALGIIGAAAEAGGVLGPLYGAELADIWGWRIVFLINVPLGLGLLAAGWWLIPRSTGEQGEGQRIDFAGAALLALSLTSLVVGIGGSTETGAGAIRPEWLTTSAVSFLAFVGWQLRYAHPLISLDLFRRIPFSAANLANVAVGAALIVGLVEIPLFAYSLLGESEVGGARLLLRLTLMIPVGAVVGGWLADKAGYRIVGAAGFTVTGLGYLLVSSWPADPASLLMTRDLAITGFGLGLVIAPINATVIASTGARWMATGAALVTVARMVGMMVGLAALSSWGIRRFNSLMVGTEIPLQTGGMTDTEYQTLVRQYEETLGEALRTVYAEFFVAAAVIAFVAVIPALFLLRRRREPA